ncbi:hypothetical protein ACIQU6_15355 [Streptomyces sp. NPDC090442]|uniref:hypothetical protein n=1 Tax=Streptomyces sp. NPDC090442 TaxID=3365962 RepID=UPI0037F25E5E
MHCRSTVVDRAARVTAAVLCLAVVWVHVEDQGGIPGDETPRYIALAYYLVEGGGIVCAGLLLAGLRTGRYRDAWLLAAWIADGPLLGSVLAWIPEIPERGADDSYWSDPPGGESVVVEVLLLTLSLAMTLLEPPSRRPSP